MTPRRISPLTWLLLALAVLAAAAVGSMRFTVIRLRDLRARRLAGSAEVLQTALRDLDPYLVDPAEGREAVVRMRRLVAALGLSEAAVIEVGDRVLVSTSSVDQPGAPSSLALAAPEQAAAAWEGRGGLSPPLETETGRIQAAFVPRVDDEGEVATVLVALAGREDFAALDELETAFRGVVFGALFVVLGLLVAARASRRRAERAEADLERSRRLGVAGQVAAGVVHEVRNPLGVMRASIEFLRDQAGADHPDRDLYDDALEEADRISETLDRFLALARDAPANPETIGVAAEVTRVARLAEKDLTRRGFAIEASCEPPGLTARCDPRLLRQSLLNLVLNARAALEGAGREAGTVRLAAGPAGTGEVAVWCQDDGPGFAPEILREPFEAFRSGRPDGTGLGLALVRRFAEGAGGRAEAENLAGGGARVRLILPAAIAEGGDAGDEAREAPGG